MGAAAEKFEDRVRFNWGFWEGRSDAQSIRGRDRRTIRAGELFAIPADKAYADGYALGFDGASEPAETSDAAWSARQSERKLAAAARKAQREARPDLHVRRF